MTALKIMRYFKTPMPRRERDIGTYQTRFGRFCKLRQPWDDLEGRLWRNRCDDYKRISMVRPWATWRSRLEKRNETM